MRNRDINCKSTTYTTFRSTKWSPVKNLMTAQLGNKCWHTEAELVEADLTIDHYRPKCDYWWLAFDVSNYRIAYPFANSPKGTMKSTAVQEARGTIFLSSLQESAVQMRPL